MNDTQKHPTNPAGEWFAITGKGHLAEYRYDPKTRELDVKFKGNPSPYRYGPVSIEMANDFKSCPDERKVGSVELTKGEFLSRYVKADTSIAYRKLTEEEAK